MSLEAAIYLLIAIAVIVVVAWVIVYILAQVGIGHPVDKIVWLIAALMVLLVLLRAVGVLHLAGLETAAVAFLA